MINNSSSLTVTVKTITTLHTHTAYTTQIDFPTHILQNKHVLYRTDAIRFCTVDLSYLPFCTSALP